MKRFQLGLVGLFLAGIQNLAVLNMAEGRAIELECVCRLIDLLTESSTAVSTTMLAKDRTILVHRAVDFMHGRLKVPLTAMDLCAELGTTDRSLRRAFREAFGMGPLVYFRVCANYPRKPRGGPEDLPESYHFSAVIATATFANAPLIRSYPQSGFFGKAKDQMYDHLPDSFPADAFPLLAVIPLLGHQHPMPPQDRVRREQGADFFESLQPRILPLTANRRR